MKRNQCGEWSPLLDIWFLSQGLTRWLEHHAAHSLLSPDEYAFCSVVGRGGDTISQLAEFTGMPISTVSSMTNRLKERGLLDSVPHPVDGRARCWRLTEEGLRQRDLADAECGDALRQLSGGALSEAIEDARPAIIALDDLLRADLGLPTRHRQVKPAGLDDPLTAEERAEVARFEQWLRHRRGQA